MHIIFLSTIKKIKINHLNFFFVSILNFFYYLQLLKFFKAQLIMVNLSEKNKQLVLYLNFSR